MERKRKQKILMIVALIMSIASVSIGFAAFSSILTISSSATVTPTDDGFKLVMYGFTGETESDFYDFNKYSSVSSSKIFRTKISDDSGEFIDNVAVIDNGSFTLNMGEVEFKIPDFVFGTIVIISNKGNYDVYIDMTKLSEFVNGECVAGDNTSKTLVDAVCPYIIGNVSIESEATFLAAQNGEADGWAAYNEAIDKDCFFKKDGVCKLEKGSKAFLTVAIGYMTEFTSDENDNKIDITPMADGPFTVSFPDIKLEFTTDSTGYVED